MNESAARSPRTRDEQAANAQHTRDEQAANAGQTRYLFAPLMREFRSYLKKDVANAPQIWLPVECNLIFRYEFAACTLPTRYIFAAILLYCGARGTDEIPADIKFLASALNADARTVEKSLIELENFGLLAERKKEREEKKDTDRAEKRAARGVSVEFENSSRNEIENRSENRNDFSNNGSSPEVENENPKRSRFGLEDCLRYVEKCKSDGDAIQNTKALATKLHRTGEADAFILKTLYPQTQKEIDREIFGEPRAFTAEPCRVCFGAKMADADGKGFRACEHCKNERGKSTGFEPQQGERKR